MRMWIVYRLLLHLKHYGFFKIKGCSVHFHVLIHNTGDVNAVAISPLDGLKTVMLNCQPQLKHLLILFSSDPRSQLIFMSISHMHTIVGFYLSSWNSGRGIGSDYTIHFATGFFVESQYQPHSRFILKIILSSSLLLSCWCWDPRSDQFPFLYISFLSLIWAHWQIFIVIY